MKARLAALGAAALWFAIANPASAGFVIYGVGHPAAVRHTPMETASAAAAGADSHFETTHPWVEGETPALENQIFEAAYPTLPMHNVLKVYAYDTGGFTAAGIRVSARAAHTDRDLDAPELEHEAAGLIRTAFDRFPQVDEIDVWATIPVPADERTRVQSTLFSVSADRQTYEAIRSHIDTSDAAFLGAFGRIWVSPKVPRA